MVKAQAGILEDDDVDVVADKLGRAVRDVVDEERGLGGGAAGPARRRRGGVGRREPRRVVHRLAVVPGVARRPPPARARLRGRPLGRRRAARLHRPPRRLGDRRTDAGALHRPTRVARASARLGRRTSETRSRSTSHRSPTRMRRSCSRLVLDRAVLPAETQQALLERASGNPLYAEQFARLYLERGTVDDLALPESVHGLIAARLDALPADEKALLQDAAVIGQGLLVRRARGRRHRPERAALARAQGVHPARATLVRFRRGRVRVPPRARA